MNKIIYSTELIFFHSTLIVLPLLFIYLHQNMNKIMTNDLKDRSPLLFLYFSLLIIE